MRRDTLQQRLLDWHAVHGRTDLPWQQTRDPYAIWVSEIMLQQTRVSAVIPYYEKFMARFADVEALARAEEDEVLHYWSGLGYYARARNLHAAGKEIVARYGGEFPRGFAEVQALPGIGRSTAAAILVFAHGGEGEDAPRAILDGNVKRVLTRYYAIAGHPSEARVAAELWRRAEALVADTPRARIRDYTQALMDLGAGVCLPRKPMCEECPLVADCQARRRGAAEDFPHSKAKPARPRKAVVMLVVENARAELLLVKRPPGGIWGGLWSLPEYPLRAVRAGVHLETEIHRAMWRQVEKSVLQAAIVDWCQQEFGVGIELVSQSFSNSHSKAQSDSPPNLLPRKHSFTHFDLDILPLRAVCRDSDACDFARASAVMEVDQFIWYHPKNAAAETSERNDNSAKIGLPAAVTRILQQLAR